MSLMRMLWCVMVSFLFCVMFWKIENEDFYLDLIIFDEVFYFDLILWKEFVWFKILCLF